ncbi:hypothetical protein KM043_013172 [Ampulex compressa]|nr:hypothetical protein KM043_013172 [Ampulex compressa]
MRSARVRKVHEYQRWQVLEVASIESRLVLVMRLQMFVPQSCERVNISRGKPGSNLGASEIWCLLFLYTSNDLDRVAARRISHSRIASPRGVCLRNQLHLSKR